MREQLINIFSKIIEGGLILLVFLLPLFFLPITSEAFEFPKQILLFFFVSVLTIFWAIKMILERKVKILHSPLTLPILIFFGIFIISIIFSVHRFSSIYGPYPRLHGGLISLISYLLTFFLVAANLKEKKQISRILISLSLSGFLLVTIGILNFFDRYLLKDFLINRFLTPAGSADATSLFLALLLPILLFTFFFGERKILSILPGVISFCFIFYIFLISTLPAILSVFLIFFLVLLFAQLKLSRGTAIKIGIFFLILLFLLAINNWDFIRSKIPLLKERPIQHDIALDQNTGWAITTGGFQNLKFLALGSGPGTYLFDFTVFKPVRFNQTPLWDLRFEKSSNEYFQIASTLGLLGLIAFIYILLTIIRIAKGIWSEKEIFLGATLSSILVFIFISFFVSSVTLTSFAFWLFLGLFLASANLVKATGIREVELSLATVQAKGLGIRLSSAEVPEVKGEILPWLVALITLLILVPLLWRETKIFQAELYFTKAQAEQFKERPNPDFILQSLQKARNTMPQNDAYRRALSATSLNFALLAEQQKALSQEVKQQLLQMAILEGEMAALRIAPHNIFNWENLQQIYTRITVPQQEDLLFNTVFPQEILLDPRNPRHYNDRGWSHFNFRNDTEAAKDDFRTATDLKQDFADAHYNLAKVYREEGKKDRALQEYEQTLNLLNQQISQLEPIASARPDFQSIFNQLKQSEEQVRKEKENLQLEIEKEKAPLPEEVKPPEEIPGPTEETPIP